VDNSQIAAIDELIAAVHNAATGCERAVHQQLIELSVAFPSVITDLTPTDRLTLVEHIASALETWQDESGKVIESLRQIIRGAIEYKPHGCIQTPHAHARP